MSKSDSFFCFDDFYFNFFQSKFATLIYLYLTAAYQPSFIQKGGFLWDLQLKVGSSLFLQGFFDILWQRGLSACNYINLCWACWKSKWGRGEDSKTLTFPQTDSFLAPHGLTDLIGSRHCRDLRFNNTHSQHNEHL